MQKMKIARIYVSALYWGWQRRNEKGEKGGLTHHEKKNTKKMARFTARCHDDSRVQQFRNIQFSERFKKHDQHHGAAAVTGKPE